MYAFRPWVRISSALLATSLLAIVACSNDTTAPSSTTGTVDVLFNLNVDGAPLQLNSLIYQTPAGTKYSIKKLRFVISNVVMHTDDGRSAKIADVYYFDIADASTQTLHFDKLPHANWESITFTYGLDGTRNVRNKYANMPKFHATMQWPTILGPTLGYHYMQIEGDFEQTPGGATAGYTTHTGARQLDGTNPDFPGVVDATPYHHFFDVALSFTPTHIHEGGTGELQVNFNLNDWYRDNTPTDGNDTSYDFTTLTQQMIMGNLAAQDKLEANGQFCFSATLTASGGHDH
jgi:MbnP